MEKLTDTGKVAKFIANDPPGMLAFQYLHKHAPSKELWCDDPGSPTFIWAIFGETGYFTALDEGAVDKFIGEMQVDNMMLAGVRHNWAEKIMAAREPNWCSPCHLVYWPDIPFNLTPEYRTRDLTPDDVPLINQYWDIGHGEAGEYIRERILNGLHAGIDDEDGLVSWAMTHFDGSMGFFYTMERGRRKGYGSSVSVAHMRKIIDAGETPFAYIKLDNDVSLSVAESIGLKRAGQADYFGYYKRD